MEFEYNCPHCGAEMKGSFGEDVFCKTCNIIFETECDFNCSEDGDEHHYAWLTGKETTSEAAPGGQQT